MSDSLGEAWRGIGDAWRELDSSWSRVATVWRDANARAFEGAYLRPLGAQVVPTQKMLEALAGVIHSARANVS
jgi:hypothetical protein